jgi:transcriptional regulator with AAA-type ATPase domain/polyferredoxin
MFENDTLSGTLHTSVLFKDVDSNNVEQIIAAGKWQRFEQGQYVYRQGEKCGRFYIVAEGEVELSLNVEDGGRHVVGHIGPGGHFGETSLLTNSNNSLNLRALSNLSLLSYDDQQFSTLLLSNTVIQRHLNIALANRLRVSFQDHANTLTHHQSRLHTTENDLDRNFLQTPRTTSSDQQGHPTTVQDKRLKDSSIARQIDKAITQFSTTRAPVILTGETGTGRTLVAREIHLASTCSNGPYAEIDMRNIDPVHLDGELYGCERDSFAFSQINQLGVFERTQGGTVVLLGTEYLEHDIQLQLARVIQKGEFQRIGGENRVALRSRVILICDDTPGQQDGHTRIQPSLYTLFQEHHFKVAPLRQHRRDIPRLIQYYLRRYSLQYGKHIDRVDDQTLGKFMNYDWPGNLTELAGVVQRAVILGKNNEPLSDQILLGMPRPEGKWEYNLLRLRLVRAFITSRLFPVFPRAVVGIFFILVLAALFFGTPDPEKNIGLTLSWVIGWPLLIFSFFFLARTWCSVCGLAVPGWLAQSLLKPQRPTPKFIREYSGWIVGMLCILLFWIETVWNAYHSPRLTAWIIFTITLSSLFFSIFYKRRVWCRYLCPLGAINALFSMPSILELRSNSHMCMNRCSDHSCYNGEDGVAGCPMFRHPFLVDNNRDCILCGQCVKNCKQNAIHLNLRLAPQELWNQQSPRLENSFLVISLAAIFFPFAVSQNFPTFIQSWTTSLHVLGLPQSTALASNIFFFGCITIYLSGYTLMSLIMAQLTGNNWKQTASILGYGMIPLVLGGFMAAHLEILIHSLWLLPANLLEMAGISNTFTPVRAISRDATFVLQTITVSGGLIASLYATQRIIKRLLENRFALKRVFALPAFLLCLSALAYLQLV